MNSIHDFVMRGGQKMTAGRMDAFKRELPVLKIKAVDADTPELPHFREQILFLVRYAEDVLEGVYACADLTAIAETVFGLEYLLKDVDIIPDSVPGKGFNDDSLVLRSVLINHEDEFRVFAEKSGLHFEKVTTEA